MTLILLLAPGILASAYYCKQKGISYRSIEFLIYTVIFIFLINLFILSVAYLRGHGSTPLNNLFIILGNATKYGILALISSLTFPNILLLFDKLRGGKKE